MRREFVEDAALVIGGAVVIAGAWMVYWLAGVIAAGLVAILFGIVAIRHHGHHAPAKPEPIKPEQPHGHMSAAAWRFHVPGTPHGTSHLETQ